MEGRVLHERMVKDAALMMQLRSAEKQTFIRDDGENVVVIPKAKFFEMLEQSEKLESLEAAGVDNWSGYGEAMAMMEEEDDFDD